MTPAPDIGPVAIRAAIAAALRQRVGMGKRFTVAEVSHRTGIGSTTLKCYLRGAAEPGLSQYLKLCAVLGESFASEIAHIAGFDMVLVDPLEVSTGDLTAKTAALVASTAESMRGQGRVTHQTDAQIRSHVEAVVEAGRSWLASRPRFSRRGEHANDDAPGFWTRLWPSRRASA